MCFNHIHLSRHSTFFKTLRGQPDGSSCKGLTMQSLYPKYLRLKVTAGPRSDSRKTGNRLKVSKNGWSQVSSLSVGPEHKAIQVPTGLAQGSVSSQQSWGKCIAGIATPILHRRKPRLTINYPGLPNQKQQAASSPSPILVASGCLPHRRATTNCLFLSLPQFFM